MTGPLTIGQVESSTFSALPTQEGGNGRPRRISAADTSQLAPFRLGVSRWPGTLATSGLPCFLPARPPPQPSRDSQPQPRTPGHLGQPISPTSLSVELSASWAIPASPSPRRPSLEGVRRGDTHGEERGPSFSVFMIAGPTLDTVPNARGLMEP